MDAGAERQVMAGPLPADDEAPGLVDRRLVAIARDVPHHDLVTPRDLLAGELTVACRSTAHMDDRRLVADGLRHEARQQASVGPYLVDLRRVFDHRDQPAGHRIACRIVAPHDQQPEGADELAQRHVLGGLGVGHHRDQVEFGRLGGAFLPKGAHDFGHLHQLGHAVGFAFDHGVGVLDIGDGDIRPVRELSPVRPWEVEQRGQHHRGEFGRHAVDPIEDLVARQAVEHRLRAFAYRAFHVGEVGGRHDGGDRSALGGMSRRVHADEVGQFRALGLVGDLDAAQFGGRRVGAGIELDLHDVGKAGHRPVGSVGAIGVAMHGIFPPQPLEMRSPAVVPIETRITDVGLQGHP